MNPHVSNLTQLASVRRYELLDGKGAGLKVIDCDNGKIRFLLNESKALDIMQIYYKGENISFVSKNGFSMRSDIPFSQRFEGGMLYTCGLDNIGYREGYPLHGTFHNLPANIIKIECNDEFLFVEAEMECSELFGKNLVMRRRVFSNIKWNNIIISDTLTNNGYRNEDYCLLYHVNLGYPLLEEGCEIHGAIENVKPRTPFAKEQIQNFTEITSPVLNQEETCYFLSFKKPCISLINPKSHREFSLEWSQNTLPSFVEWKSMASGDYALGLEPCTSELDSGFSKKVIKPQESIDTYLIMTIKDIE